MLINLSNHPVSKWSDEQLSAAQTQFGDVVDLPFPTVDPQVDEETISALADDFVSRVAELADNHSVSVHLMGEMTLTFILVSRLQQRNISCVASTTQRIVNELPDGGKEVKFQFVRFRKYAQL